MTRVIKNQRASRQRRALVQAPDPLVERCRNPSQQKRHGGDKNLRAIGLQGQWPRVQGAAGKKVKDLIDRIVKWRIKRAVEESEQHAAEQRQIADQQRAGS